MAQQPLVRQSLLIIETSQSHSDTPYSVGLLWTGDQTGTETSTKHTQHSLHFPGGIRTHNPNKQVAADPRLRQRGHKGWAHIYFFPPGATTPIGGCILQPSSGL